MSSWTSAAAEMPSPTLLTQTSWHKTGATCGAFSQTSLYTSRCYGAGCSLTWSMSRGKGAVRSAAARSICSIYDTSGRPATCAHVLGCRARLQHHRNAPPCEKLKGWRWKAQHKLIQLLLPPQLEVLTLCCKRARPCMLPGCGKAVYIQLVYKKPRCCTSLCVFAYVPHSRWGCQWTSSCLYSNGSQSCAPILYSYGLAAAAIWQADPTVPIFINGLGQNYNDKWLQCGRAYPGMHWVSEWAVLEDVGSEKQLHV